MIKLRIQEVRATLRYLNIFTERVEAGRNLTITDISSVSLLNLNVSLSRLQLQSSTFAILK